MAENDSTPLKYVTLKFPFGKLISLKFKTCLTTLNFKNKLLLFVSSKVFANEKLLTILKYIF